MKQLKIMGILLMMLVVSGCWLFKAKQKDKHSEQSSLNTDSAAKVKIWDRSVVTTTEELDTTIKTAPVSINKNIPAKIEADGSAYATLDTLMLKVKIGYNSLKETFSIDLQKESELLSALLKRKKVEEKNIQSDIDTKVKSKEKTKLKDTKIKTDNQSIGRTVVWVTGIVIVLFLLLWLIFRKAKNK